MRVVVKPHEEIRPLLRAWRHALNPDRARRHELAEILWAELVERIVKAQGPPLGLVTDATTDPPTFWCELSGGTWVQLVVQPDRRTGLFRYEREVVIINLAQRPPAATPQKTD
jgi:hypothetical protein